MKKIYLFLLFVIVLVPLGLLTQNPAWGEWENTHYKETLGFVPKGIENGFSLKALFPDYATSFLGEVGSYYFSAIVGVLVIFFIFLVLKKVVKVER